MVVVVVGVAPISYDTGVGLGNFHCVIISDSVGVTASCDANDVAAVAAVAISGGGGNGVFGDATTGCICSRYL